MSAFAKRIKEYRLERNLDQPDIAKLLGVTKQTVSGWESGKYSPPLPKVVEMAIKLNVDLNWLIGSSNAPRLKPIRINVLGRVPAGVPVEAVEDIIDWEELDPREYDTNKSYFGLLVTGESMSPKYLDGDVVIIEQTEDADSGKDVIAYINGHDATLKRLVKYGNGNVDLKPLNPAYQTMTFTPSEIETKPVKVIGIVKELRRKI